MKDLSEVIVDGVVKAKDFHYTQFVTTVVCVVPVVAIPQFTEEYWRVTDYVIPNSAKKLKTPEKDGLSLWYNSIYAGLLIFSTKRLMMTRKRMTTTLMMKVKRVLKKRKCTRRKNTHPL